MTNQKYQKCIDACLECATECNHCAVACLEEKEVQHLTQCIRLNLECAVICRVTAELMTTGSAYSAQICELCATICNACAEKCQQHANMGMEHCRECAETCRACAKETMEIAGESTNKNYIIHQDECAILSRAAAELISLGSAWSKQISELNATVCNEFAEALEKQVNIETKNYREYSKIATEAHQHLEKMQGNDIKKDEATESKDKEQPVPQKEINKKKKKHSSALLAASMGRSAMDHVHAHSSSIIRGRSGLANTGTMITYEADE
ncbi:MAG: four-helix bundle copper-binding protein [Ferruginibacter sp.]